MRSVRNAPKRAINLNLNSKVLDMARGMGLNISQTVDALLTEEVLRRYCENWQQDNAEAIAHYNERIAREGTFAQRIRAHLAETSGADAAAG
jgi:antitoxin CcdA